MVACFQDDLDEDDFTVATTAVTHSDDNSSDSNTNDIAMTTESASSTTLPDYNHHIKSLQDQSQELPIFEKLSKLDINNSNDIIDGTNTFEINNKSNKKVSNVNDNSLSKSDMNTSNIKKKSKSKKKNMSLDDWLDNEDDDFSNPYVSGIQDCPEGNDNESIDEEQNVLNLNNASAIDPLDEFMNVSSRIDANSAIQAASTNSSRSESPVGDTGLNSHSSNKKESKHKKKSKSDKDSEGKSLKKHKKKNKDKEGEKEEKKKKKKKKKDKDELENFLEGSPERNFDEAYEAI